MAQPLSEGELIGGGAPLRKGPTAPAATSRADVAAGVFLWGTQVLARHAPHLAKASRPRGRRRAQAKAKPSMARLLHWARSDWRGPEPANATGGRPTQPARKRRNGGPPRSGLNHNRRRRRTRHSRRRQRRQRNRRHHSRPHHTHPRFLPLNLRRDNRIRMRRRSNHRPPRRPPRRRHPNGGRHRGELHGRLIPTDLSHLRLNRSSIRRPRNRHNPGGHRQPSKNTNCDKRDTHRNGGKRQTRTHPPEGSDQTRRIPSIRLQRHSIALKLPSNEW
ncbi:hypothetical protein C8D88_1011182 [Lentzea atacamensis]|uniref:Uncharacterized protein n=1 Tax=Lentzea atacamensis TaxID=531938 RepID=A0A316IEP1_9PSEU|nr:hypothetical protein C8D88_1011182 [Lentzea atacamensis]